jgi:hypothetical protein
VLDEMRTRRWRTHRRPKSVVKSYLIGLR